MKLFRSLAVALPLACLAALPVVEAGCISIISNGIVGTTQKSNQVADARSLTVESRNGRITLIRDPAATSLKVTATIRCSGETQEDADKRAADSKLVVDRQNDGTVRVSVTFPPREKAKGGYSSDGASLEIRAASLDGVNLISSNGSITADGFSGAFSARTSNGGVKVTGHNGAVQVDTSNGAIEATDLAGPAELETSNGGVDASLAKGSSQNVNIRTSNGSVKLTLPATWNGAMTGKTSNGKVSVKGDLARTSNVSTARGEGSATIGNGNATASVRSSNGSISVVVSAEASAAPEKPASTGAATSDGKKATN